MNTSDPSGKAVSRHTPARKSRRAVGVSIFLLAIPMILALAQTRDGAAALQTSSSQPVNASGPRRGTSPGTPEARLAYTPGQAPAFWSLATAETIMARYPDYRRAYWKDWSYVQGYMFYGFEMLYRATGDKRYLDYIKQYIDHFIDARGNFTGEALANLDNLMPGNAVVALYEYTHDERYKTAATQFLHALDNYPRSADGQFWHSRGKANMWIDGIFMGQMFTIRYGHAIGERQRCFDEAARQITVFARHCRKGDSGLYLHAWTEEGPDKAPWADPLTHRSPEVWSEGLGWYALILAETLAVLPPEHPQRAEVLAIYRGLAAGLKRTQDAASGGWWLIVDKGGQPGNWIDPSGSAMFVYSLQRGVELGLLERSDYAPVAARGYRALLQCATINDRGLVDISGAGDGITIKKDYAAYVGFKRVVNAKEAVAGFLWASAIMEKAGLKKLKMGIPALQGGPGQRFSAPENVNANDSSTIRQGLPLIGLRESGGLARSKAFPNPAAPGPMVMPKDCVPIATLTPRKPLPPASREKNALQIHNARLFDEYRDIRIATDPKEDRLITVN